jgi:stage III sporulation protein AB
MRLFGAMLIFIACSAAGALRAAALWKKVKTLSAVEGMLRILSGEICGRLSDIKTALGVLKRSSPPETADFIGALCGRSGEIGEMPFSRLWSECAAQTLGVLGADELSELCALGTVLGRYDAPTQKAAMENCAEYFRQAHAEALPRVSGSMKAAFGAGASLGLIIMITLI